MPQSGCSCKQIWGAGGWYQNQGGVCQLCCLWSSPSWVWLTTFYDIEICFSLIPKNMRILIQCINTNFVIWTKYACCKFSNNFSKVHCTHFLPHYYFMAQETLSQQNYTGLWTAPGCLLSKWSVSYRCLILCFQSMLSLPIIIDPLIIYLLSTALYFEVLETLIRKYKVCFK